MENAGLDARSTAGRIRGIGIALAVTVACAPLLPAGAVGTGAIVRESGVRTVSFAGAQARVGVALPDDLVVAGSDSLVWDGSALRRDVDYSIDYETGAVRFMRTFPDSAIIDVSYRFLPFELESVYHHAALESLASLPPWLSGGSELVDTSAHDAPALPSDLRVGGAKTFGIKMGSDRDPSLEQSLRLNVSGSITRDVRVNAYLSDQNTPLVPEGDTEELRAIDRVLIEIEGENASATMGDVELAIDGGSLFSIRRDLKGATATASVGRAELTLAGAKADGEFASHTFRGVDGKQGPYLLVSGDGRTGVGVVAGSERVWLDGVRLRRGRDNDYVIDYASGELEFTETRQITSDHEVTVDYEYSLSDFERDIYGGRGEIAWGGAATLGLSFFRETDDEGTSLSTVLGDDEIAVLSAVGDALELARDSGVDSVGVGGDYTFVEEGVFEYAGVDSGAYDLSFEYEEGGDYVYDFEKDHYVYAGPGEGEYGLGRKLPAPTDRGLGALDARLELPGDGVVAIEAAVSTFDVNTFSDLDDDDNLGNAQVLAAELPRARFGAEGGGTVGLGVKARRVGGNFENVGRFREVGYVERWELEGLDLPREELMIEGRGTAALEGRGELTASYAHLTRGDAVTSRKTEFSLDARPGAGTRFSADGRLVDLDSDEGSRERTLLRGSLEKDVGPLVPGVSYRHDSRAAPGSVDERYDEYAASLRSAGAAAFAFGARYAHRATDRRDDDEWARASTTRTQEYSVRLRGGEKLSLEATASRRVTEFEPGFADAGSKYDVASVRANHRSLGGALTGELRYSVTSTEIEEKKKQVTVEDGVETTRILPTGRFFPVTDLSAGTRWEFRFRSRGGRGPELPDPSPFGRFLSALSLETDVKLNEVTTTGEKWRLYVLDPGVVRGDDTVRGEVTGRHVARYVAADGSRSVRLVFKTRDGLDRSYLNVAERRKERGGTVDLKLSPSGSVTYRIEGDVGRRELRSEGTGYSYEIDERSALFEVTARRLGDLEARLTGSVRGTDERLEGIALTETTVTPSLTYRLRGKGALTASFSRIDLSADVEGLPVYLAEGRPPGVTSEWRVTGDYRLNRFLTSSLSYVGERRPDSVARHTVDVRVNAFF